MRKKLYLLILLAAAIMLPTYVNAEETSQYITLGEASHEVDTGSVQFTAKTDIASSSIEVYPVLCEEDKCANGKYQNEIPNVSLGLNDLNNDIAAGQTFTIGYTGNGDTYNGIVINIDSIESILIGLPFGDEGATMSVSYIGGYGFTVDDYGNNQIIEEGSTIDSSFFELIKRTSTKYQVGSKDGSYAWIFDGSKIDDTNFNINLKLTIGSGVNKKKVDDLIPIGKDNPLYLHFDYHGNLPKGTSVKIRVSDKYKDGEKLTLYYYNESTGKLEEVAKDLEVKGGYVEFGLEHCSDYVLASNDNSNNAQTSSMNTTMYLIISLVSLIGGIISIIIIRKKKIA